MAEAVTPASEDIASLLSSDPDAAALRYLSETILFKESEAEFISAMSTLSQSRSPSVATLAADTLSTGYHIAVGAGFDIGDAIEKSLRGPPHIRRLTVRNLGQFEAPEVRRWLQERLDDTGVDATHADGRTVAEEARAGLARLDRAKKEGRSVSPRDPLSVTVATVGTPLRAPIGEGPCELLVEIESVTSPVASRSRLREPSVGATFTIVLQGSNSRVGVLRLQSVSMYAGGYLKTGNALLFVYCRPVAKDRVRCWYRAEVEASR